MRHSILTLFCFCSLGLLASQQEARLQRIVVDGIEIPAFNADIHTYTVQLPYTSTSHPHIVAECMDENASYTVNDNVITCVAGDGKTKMQYVVQTEVLPELDIYLCIGQSNMAGRGAFNEATADMTGIYLLNGTNQFIPSPARMSQYSNVASDSNDQYWIGPHYQFALDVRAATGKTIGMVVNARGGSGIESWIPSATGTTQCYSKTLTRLKAALAYGKLKGILWHQGCNQAYGSYCMDAKNYYAYINELVNGLRKEVDDKDVWFIAGQLAEIGKDADMHIKFNQTVMNDNIKSAVHNCDYVVSGDVTINPADPIHWDYAGACLMGGRYAKKILSHVYGKEFKIAYNLKGGHWSGQTPDSVIQHTTPTPTPTKDGADFWGWFWEEDFSGKQVKQLFPDASGTLFARWSDMERNKVTGVTLTPDTLLTYMGMESTLQANIIPIDATVKDLIWTSSDENIVSISQTGVVTTAQNIGSATIVVTTLDGNFADSCVIIVREQPRVIYDLNGGARVSSTGKCIVLVQVIEKDNYSLATPYKMGCTFEGWFWEEDFSGKPVETLNIGASGTLYAKWNCTEEPKCNEYGWATPEDMYQDLAADVIAAKKAGFAFTFASTFNTKKTFGKATNVHDVSGISYDIQTFDMTFFNKTPYKAKWGWLLSYMKARCKSEGVSAPTDNAGIRYNLAAFFSDGKGYSWDMNTPTADYTIFGVSSTEYYPMLGAVLCDETSAIQEETVSGLTFDNSVTKHIQNGQLFICREGITYNILGTACQ